MHFMMHACWKKLLCRRKLWQQKNLQNLHHVLDSKMGVEKWTQKWCQNLTPKMGSKNGTPKWGPKMAPKRGPNILIKKKSKLYLHLNPFFGCNFCTPFWGAIFGPHFGGQILASFLGPLFNPHFGVQNMVQILQIFLLPKLSPA